jgi:multidrug efflux system membrane fusion protein
MPSRVVVAAACALALACSRQPRGPKPARAIAVRAVAVAARDVPMEVRAVGRIVSSQSVVVRPEVSGRILAVHFSEGQTVKQGDLLLEIDPLPYRTALAQAQARLAQDRARAGNARADASRYAKLLEKSFVAEQQHSTAQAEATAQEATVAGDQAAVDRAELDLTRCAIRAPAPGRTGRLLVHVGNTVSADTAEPLVTIERRRPVHAEFFIPERYLAALRLAGGAAPPVWVKTEGGLERQGSLEFIDNVVDAATGTILLRAGLANEDDALWPGQAVEVRLRLELRRGALVVPAGAVAQGQQGDYAYVVTAKRTVELRPVQVEPAGDDAFVVVKGLAAGELVVSEGQIKLTPGAQVELIGEKDGA